MEVDFLNPINKYIASDKIGTKASPNGFGNVNVGVNA
jgi:hypothetical protein